MASGKKATARRPASSRNTGTRKSGKISESKENIPPVQEKSRPKPRPKYKRNDKVTEEEEAAATLVSMATPAAAPVTEECSGDNNSDIPADPPHDNTADADYDDKNSISSEEDEDDSDGSDDVDDSVHEKVVLPHQELDDAVRQIIPPVKIPPAKFDIPFEVPYKGGMRDLTGITSRSSFDDFLLAAAGRMGTRITQLDNIAYIPSYKPRNPKPLPKILDDDDAWEVLVGDVRQYIKASLASNRGKGQLKPFNIQIVDLSQSEESTKTGKNKGRKGRKNEKSGDESQPVPALKEHDLFKEIEKKHYCQECKTACVVLNSGDHHILTHIELATWAMLASRHKAIIDEAPKDLNLDITHKRQAKALVPVLGAIFNPRLGASVAEPAPQHMIRGGESDPRMTIPHSNLIPPTGTKRPAEDAPGPDICPEITVWLMTLDSDPIRGRLNLNYTQYKDLLLGNGFFELSDLANVTADKLLALSAEQMNFGIANRLVTYAKEDFDRMSGHTSKQARVN
ncbi:hypothetical protein B0H19DRAFT_1065782 [Mycena capillaripes]|nr:hypothetical protein B0H19DRAFT_1065782 [Mycena capillaripes]